MVTVKRTRKTKTKSNGAPAQSTPPVVNLSARSPDRQAAIRLYAYSLYEQRGGEHGHDLDDWLRAEGELTRIGA